MYITYQNYVTYGGTLVPSEEFQRYEFLAETILDWYTFNRLQNETTFSERIQRLMVELIELAKKRNDALSLGVSAATADDGGYVTSQSNDGVSISYNGMNASDLYSLIKAEAADIINRQLQGVVNSAGSKLLYRGLYPGE